MTHDFSVFQLLLEATWVVQAVVLLLLSVSVMSWAAIFRKVFALKKVQQHTEQFEKQFWSGANLGELYQGALANAQQGSPTERVFASGMREFNKLRERRETQPDVLVDGARRAMRAGFQREVDALEVNLSFLGTVGSVSPYVGLFGTVWGIMHAFTGLAAMSQVTLAAVAPGIAEALVATAISLFAAIPAVVAYNRFTHDIDRVANRLETFMDEFSNILHRNVGVRSTPASH